MVFNESILISCQFWTSHGLVVHHVWNSFISIFSERFSVCGILSLYASVSPSSDAELSNSCLQLLQLYKLVGLCQLVPANLMASTWDLFTATSMQMNFESRKSRYHCLHIHNYSWALLRDLIIMFSLFCIYYYVFAFRSLYHPSISLFDDNNHDGKTMLRMIKTCLAPLANKVFSLCQLATPPWPHPQHQKLFPHTRLPHSNASSPSCPNILP